MDVHVRGGPAEPFLGARDLFATEYDLDRPVTVTVRADPDERTRVRHDADGHYLTISRQAATSAMARELALHEYAHMARHEEGHPSHTQSTREAIYLGLAGRSVERRTLTHCHQLANHMKDVYADDVWLRLAPADKLVRFFESRLAAAVADAPRDRPGWRQLTAESDPSLTAVNAAFALALLERHDLLETDHRIYDLAASAAADAPAVDLPAFKEHFRSLAPDPDEGEYRRALVAVTQDYAVARAGGQPAE